MSPTCPPASQLSTFVCSILFSATCNTVDKHKTVREMIRVLIERYQLEKHKTL